MTLDLRLKAYLPNGASQGLLPAPDSFAAAVPLNEVPSLTVNYGTMAPRSDLLGKPLELALEVSGDGGQTWTEPDDCRFLYLRDGRDPLKTADTYAAEAPGYVWRLQKAKVLAEGQAVEGKRPFTGKTVGFILTTLWNEAQARGALAGMTLSGNATQDAAGANWVGTISREYDLGVDYLTILQDMANAGLLDYRMTGRTLKLYKPDTVLATDRTVTATQVQLTPLQVTEAPFRRTWEGLASYLQVQGDDFVTVGLTNGAALAPWGRWEDYVTQAGVSDTGTLTALGQRYQTLTAAERAEFTQAIVLGGDGPSPLVNYWAGDYVWSRVLDGTRTKYRVRQVTLEKEGNTVRGNVVLNDRFLEEDIRTRRRLDALTGGASSSGSSGGTPSLPGADILAPKVPATAPALGTLSYLDATGIPKAQITVDWPDVSTNADDTPISDLSKYEVQQKVGTSGGAGTWRTVTFTPADTSVATLSPYDVDTTWTFRVRAIDNAGNESAWSATSTVTTAIDTTAPPTPSALVLTQRVGVIQADWDGLNNVGNAMPLDFSRVEVHASTTSGFTPVKGNPATMVDALTGAGYAISAAEAYGTTIYFRAIAVDRSGNASGPSVQAAVTVNRIVGTEITDAAVTTPKVAAGAITTDRLSVGASGINQVPNGSFQDLAPDGSMANWTLVNLAGSGATLTQETAAPIAGTASGRITLTSATNAARAFSTPVPCAPGDPIFARAKFSVSRNITAGAILSIFTSNATTDPRTGGAEQFAFTTGTLTAGQVYELARQWTIPAGHTQYALAFYFPPAADGGGGYVGLVDNVEAAVSVGDDRITTVSAGKIVTGVIQANQRIIAGDPAGARAEMNASGFQAAKTDGTITFQVNAVDGKARIGGTTGTRLEFSVEANVFESTSPQWPMIRLFTTGPNWEAGQLWGTYVTGSPNVGSVRLSSPFGPTGTNDWTKAAFLNLSSRSNGTSQAFLKADEVNMTGGTFTLGSTAGSVDLNLSGTNQLILKQVAGSGQGVVFDFSGATASMQARANGGSGIPRLDLIGSTGIRLSAGAANLDIAAGGPISSNRQIIITAGGLSVTGSSEMANNLTMLDAEVITSGASRSVVLGAPPTVSSANGTAVYRVNATGRLATLTSSIRHKKFVRDFGDIDVDAVLALRPRTFQRRASSIPDPDLPAELATAWEVGFIAEEAEELGLGAWVSYDADRLPLSFDYGGFGAVAHQAVLQAHQAELAELRERVAELEAAVQ